MMAHVSGNKAHIDQVKVVLSLEVPCTRGVNTFCNNSISITSKISARDIPIIRVAWLEEPNTMISYKMLCFKSNFIPENVDCSTIQSLFSCWENTVTELTCSSILTQKKKKSLLTFYSSQHFPKWLPWSSSFTEEREGGQGRGRK